MRPEKSNYFLSPAGQSLALYLILFFVFLLFNVLKGKAGSYLFLEPVHGQVADRLMRIITFMGDGLFAAGLALVFIFIRLRTGIFIASGWILSGFISQVFKRFVFPDSPRPHAFFKEMGMEIYRVPGIEIHLNHSFPSGHSTTAFALFIGLSFFVRNTSLRLFLFFLAILTAFSRIYLGQHFLSDVLFGSAIGVATSFILYKFVIKWKKNWLDKPVQKILFPDK